MYAFGSSSNGGSMTEKDANFLILKELFSMIKALEKDGASEEIVDQLKEIYNYFSFYIKA